MLGGTFFEQQDLGKINGTQENLNDKKSLNASGNRHDNYLRGVTLEFRIPSNQSRESRSALNRARILTKNPANAPIEIIITVSKNTLR